MVDIKTVFLFSFLFEKGMTDSVPVKGNCVDIGLSHVTVYRTVLKILLQGGPKAG